MRRVLVVEGDAMIAILLAETLAGMGHAVCAIEAAEADALAAAVQCRPDLMIVDARFGDGRGVSAVEEIRHTEFVPHVFVSRDTSRVQALMPGTMII